MGQALMYYFDLPKAGQVFKYVSSLSLVSLAFLIGFLAVTADDSTSSDPNPTVGAAR